ncbi:sulfite exporter TauE/SafE family protein [Nocardiopsis sediminis]|uniref:Probable membrane transporter protein n=1 Tax=Nocardiopsis sediminis TaxID=1778267 RepID=A0ABV8FMM6_9ACTN
MLISDPLLTILCASTAAVALAPLSAVAGFGGGILLLPVFAALFGVRTAIPVLTLTQLGTGAGRIWLNRSRLEWPLIAWFALGGIPGAALGGVLFAHAPLATLQRLLGAFLICVVVRRHIRPHPRAPRLPVFAGVGAVAGLGSTLLESIGPLTAPFLLAYGLTRGAYIGTEAAAGLTLNLTKIAVYDAGDILTPRVLLFGAALTPAILTGVWAGKKIVGCIGDRTFVAIVEAGLVVAGIVFIWNA